MEVGKKDREKVQTQVPWNPTTPTKPIVHRPVPIYNPGERIQVYSHAYGVPPCNEPSVTAAINNTRPQHWLGHGAAVTDIASKSATTGVRLALDNFPGSSNGFTELLAQAQAPSTHCYNGIQDGVLQNQFFPTLRSQFNPTYTLLGHHQFSCEQPLFNAIHHIYQEPRGTSCFAYYDKAVSHISSPAPDNAIRVENTQVTGMQLHMGEKDRRREEKEVPNAEQSNSESAHNKELCDPAIEFIVSTQSTENQNKEVSHHIDLNKTPQQKPRRRKHRPKVIKEDKPTRNRKPVTRKPVQSKENATSKRKNVRKKELNSISPQTETTGECTKPLTSESAKKTCRRSLNFEREQQRDGNSACVEFGAAITKTQAANIEETQAPSAPLLKGNSPRAKSNTSSDVGISTIGIQVVGPKRKHSGTIEHEDTSSINLTGVQYNILQAHYPELWVQFPNIQKKRRSEKGRNSNTCSTSSMIGTKDVQVVTCPKEDARSSPYASSSNFWTSGSEYNAVRVPVVITGTDRAIHNKPQSFVDNLSSGQRQTKRRSRVPTAKTCVNVERQQTGNEALVAEMHATLTKKKRTKNRSTLVSTSYSCTHKMQQNHKFVLENHSLLLDNSLDVGVACKDTWENRYTADALAVQFGQLNINRETRELVLHGQNALVPYNQQNQNLKGLANGCGTIIPYQGIFDAIKKQRPRPKVDLDEETNRVWKLLMLDINSHGIDGMDEDKAQWWEEERNVFRGRADSFIARMHLVQGDRRFTKWKGSVVDSVIGVFLTQNVSDHLSSSAFMSLAARFPLKSSNKYKTYHEESTNLIVNIPQVYIVEPEESTKLDEKLLNPSVYDLSSMTTIDIIQHSEEKEAFDSNDSCRTSGGLTSLTGESNLKMSDSTQRHMGEQHNPTESGPITAMTGEWQENSYDEGVGKEVNDMVSSQCSVITSQIHADFSGDQSTEKIQPCSESNSEVEDLSSHSSAAKNNIFYDRTSFSKLLEMASSTTLHEVNSQRSKSTENLGDVFGQPIGMKHSNQSENLEKLDVTQNSDASITSCDDYPSKMIPNSGVSDINSYDPFRIEGSSRGFSKSKDVNDMKRPRFQTSESEAQAAIVHSQSIPSQCHQQQQQSNNRQQNALHISGDLMQKTGELDFGDQNNAINENSKIKSAPTKSKSRERQKEKQDDFDWDSLRIQAEAQAGKRETTESTMDSLDWDAVRLADVKEIADAIKERGMNNMLAERIKNFLNLLVDKHGAIDLEWLRDVPPDRAKEYLLSIRGLGLKSVECVRLLTLHHLAFPVDTNVGRIAVRLGWVPLQPLPESLQLHLLELYPVLESIQKYLWPRLCKLDQRTLYELHYQLITFGKVFCTKHKPNCNACPMRGECRHFASAFASARLALPGPEQRSIVITNGKKAVDQNPSVIINQLPLPLPANTNRAEQFQQLQQIIQVSKQLEARSETNICQPIIEEPASPEPQCSQLLESDIEDTLCEEAGEIPAIRIDMEEFNLNVQNVMEENMELLENEMSKALVALTPEAACIPTPKLKNVNRLRTEHWVYELPDSHRLLEGWDKREPDDPGKYLLAIWTPGETENSTQPPERKCSSQDCDQLCDEKECFSCNSYREASSQIVRGTILIPCRTAMRGSFPLNGTYFQVNEVFADNESSINPIHVPRSWIWNLGRRTVYFGTSIPSIFKGLTTPDIQRCFWRGYVCVRGFDRETRAPRPLKARLHYPASKLAKKEPVPARPQELNLNLQPNPEQPELLSNIPNNEERQGA